MLLYPVPEVGVHVPKELLKKINGKFLKARKAIRDDPVTTSYEVYKKRVEKSVRILDGITENRIYRIKPSEIFCDSEIKGRCITHNTEVSFYRDDDHLSKFGAELIVEEFKELILSEGFHYQY